MDSTPRQIASRFFVSILSLLIVSMGFFTPESYHFKMVERGGTVAFLSALFLYSLSLFVFLDTVLNDIAPKQVRFVVDERHRHILWGWMAVTYVGYAFVTLKSDSSGLLALFFAVFGGFCASIATLDTLFTIRKGKPQCTDSGWTPFTPSSSDSGPPSQSRVG